MARLRLAVLFALIAGGIAAGWGLGGVDQLRPENVRLLVEEAGAFWLLLFCGLFVVGQVLYVPGLVFITAAAWLYGPSLGGPLALVGATLAVSVNFAFVRLVGGQPLVEVRSRILRYGLRRLERRPLLAVGLLRLLFMTSPPLNFGPTPAASAPYLSPPTRRAGEAPPPEEQPEDRVALPPPWTSGRGLVSSSLPTPPPPRCTGSAPRP